MNKKKLIEKIHEKKSFLCVGLDPDLDKFPSFILNEEDPIFFFNKINTFICSSARTKN